MRLARRRLVIALSALPVLPVKSASAQDYPARPVRVIVGYPAGGTTDIVARLTAQYLATALGQNVVVENRTGATGLIAVDAVARSPADGYTLLVVSNAEFSVVPALRPKLPFDPLKDFAPLALLASVPLLYVVPASVPAKTMSDLVALAKQRPGSIRYGSSGIGGVLHLAGEMLKHRAGIDMVHVPYKGGGELLAAALGGQIEMIAIGSASVSRHLASGELRALAVASEKRLDALPGIPTMMESGFAGFVVPSWWGIAAPAGVPVPILERLSRELVALARSAPFRSRVEQLGGVAEPLAREGFAELIARDIAQWRQLGAATGIKLEG